MESGGKMIKFVALVRLLVAVKRCLHISKIFFSSNFFPITNRYEHVVKQKYSALSLKIFSTASA